jgi:hypothetical protein
MTQPGDSGFGWNMAIGEVLAAATALGAFVWRLRLRKRRQAARNERPPQSEKILRPAGYSASCRVIDLSDRLLFALLEAAAGAVVLGILCAAFYPFIAGLLLGRFTVGQLRTGTNPYLWLQGVAMAVLALLWTIRQFSLASKYAEDLRNWRFGMRGEQAVAEKLASSEVAGAGYVVFHDVPGKGPWNIDHVVVGPGGVFVLETKTKPRRTPTRDQRDQDVIFDGKTLRFPWCFDADAAEQAERNASWVREFIGDFAPKDILVQPVIVVPGWFVETLGNYPVKAMNAKYLVGYLAGSKPHLTADQLRPIIRRIDERCRDLEF